MWIIVFLVCCGSLLCSGEDSVETGCQGEFKGKCRCGLVEYDLDLLFLTNCTDSAFTDAYMLSEIPIETEVLIFQGNNVSELSDHLLGSSGVRFDKLKIIDLSHNYIKHISSHTFDVHVSTVIELSLSGNEWSINKDSEIFSNFKALRKLNLSDAFDKDLSTTDILLGLERQFENATRGSGALHALEDIDLQNNMLEHFNNDDFMCFLISLTHLHLGNNRITHFRISTRCTHQLQFLDLSGNQIKRLTSDNIRLFNRLPNLQLDLHQNAFYCDCEIKDTTNWLKSTSLRLLDKDNYICADGYPSETKGKALESIKDEDVHCALAQTVDADENYSRAGMVILAVVLVIAAGLIAGLVYMNRASVKQFLHISTEPIRRKFEYSTIGRREENEVDV